MEKLSKKSISEFKASIKTAGAEDFVFLYNIDEDLIFLPQKLKMQNQC